MACANFIRVFCGEVEEEVKHPAFEPCGTDASEWSDGGHDAKRDTEAERIRLLEEKVAVANRCRRNERPRIRGTITCKPVDMNYYCAKHQPPSFPKSSDELDFLRQVMRECLMTALDLEDSEIDLLCMAMLKEIIPPHTVVVSKGDIGDFYYVVDEGELLFTDPDEDGKVCGRVKRGAAFGELALL